MSLKVKNPTLKKKIFRKMNSYDAKALREYRKGNLKKGRIYENASDRLYSKNYYKMFRVTR